MKKLGLKKIIMFVVFGVFLSGVVFPETSQALRKVTFTGEINFNVMMDDGSVVPNSKLPTVLVDYSLRRYNFDLIPSSGLIVLNDYINQKPNITLTYNGGGNYSHKEIENNLEVGAQGGGGNDRWAISKYLTYSNLRITNTPKYIRTVSSISSKLGSYSFYTQKTDIYYSKVDQDSTTYLRTDKDGMAVIPYPNLTRTGAGDFKYQGSKVVSNAEHPDSVQFAISGGSATGLWSDYVYNFSSLPDSGNRITFFMKGFEISENFEDESGVALSPPAGFTQGKKTEADEDQFTHTMNKLPTTYVSGGDTYVLQGWYQGPSKPGTLKTTNPPSVTIDYSQPKSIQDFDNEGEIHVVYKKGHAVEEEYIDTSGASLNSGAWDTTTGFSPNATFNGAPSSTKSDSGGTDWEYQGWKLSTDPMSSMKPKATPVSVLIDANKTIQYVYKKKQHTITEKWVDQADGSTLVPMTGNPKASSIDDNDPFNGSATATITDNNGGIWDYVGWENVTDASGTVNPASSYTINNIKVGKEIRYHYQARNTTATLDLTPNPKVVLDGGNVAWTSRLTNTGTSALNNLKLKGTSNWASGLSDPILKVTVKPAGGSSQDFTVNPGDWASGINLTGINISNVGPNNYADITFSTTATGAVNQVLPAEIEIDGNIASPLTAENFVRIDDPDEPNLEPLGNAGLINIPNFKFGEVEVKPFAQTKKLDTTAYQSGYHPYIRFMDMESTGGWSLTAKLDQFKSGTKTLPITTTIKLKNGLLMEVQNYNKHNENLGNLVLAGSVSIPSDNNSVAFTNGTNQGVYHLEYDINGVELELMAHSGIAGLSYQADMEWTLTTAP